MKTHALPSTVPLASTINARLAGAHFYDCYTIPVPDNTRTALGYFLVALANTPSWVNTLMVLRNKIVRLAGLKDIGGLGELSLTKFASAYVPGDRVGIFTLTSNFANEALLENHDKHLHVVLSVFKHPLDQDGVQFVSVTTVVHIHNLLGRIYMLPVKPMHKIIAPAVLARALCETPALFVESARLEAARRALEESDHNIETVSIACGFKSPDRMRRAFLRHVGVSPQEYRKRFQSNAPA